MPPYHKLNREIDSIDSFENENNIKNKVVDKKELLRKDYSLNFSSQFRMHFYPKNMKGIKNELIHDFHFTAHQIPKVFIELGIYI